MKTISCFSYKGGAGRSTLAINVVPFLVEELGATPEHPLILVDMDIDSCGITYLFNLDKNIDPQFNVQYLFGRGQIPRGGGSIADHVLFSHLPAVGKLFGLRDAETVLCLPAEPGESLSESGSYDANGEKFSLFIDLCRNMGCCGVLCDSSVGNQLTANWSNMEATHIMCCMRPTKQFRAGTKRFFEAYDNENGGKNIIVIPNVVPTDPLILEEDGETRHYPTYAQEQILKDFQEIQAESGNNYILDMVKGDIFGVPKIDRFMWQEDILARIDKSKLTAFEHTALGQYKKVATLIKNS